MSIARVGLSDSGVKRVAALALLLAVFSLPLHLHAPNLHAKIVTECACQHGSRTVASLATAPANPIPLFDFQALAPEPVVSFGCISIASGSIRAPPSLAVL